MRELELIKGTVKNLNITDGYDNFVFSQNSQKAAGAAATAGVAMGSFFNASVIANAGFNSSERVEFFTCKVDGLPVAGRFKNVSFKEGDELEFVVEYTNRNKQAAIGHAVRDPKQRFLWVVPEQERGTVAQKKDNIWMAKFFAYFVGGISFVAFVISELTLDSPSDGALILVPLVSLMLGGGAFLLGVLSTQFMVKRAEHANKVFAAMGYDNPEEVDLMLNTREINLQRQKEGKSIHRDDITSFRY